jgi:chromosome segregation ATPase
LAETQRECGWGAEEQQAELERDLEERTKRLAHSVQELQAERRRLAEVAGHKEELSRSLEERTEEVGGLKEALELERSKAAQLFERVELEKERLREEVESVSALLEVAQAQSREKEGELVEFVKQLDGAQSEYAVVVGRLQAVELEVLDWQGAAEGIQEEVFKEREEKGQLAEQMAGLISKAQELEAGRKEGTVLQRQLDDALRLTEEKDRQLVEVSKQVSETEKQVRELKAQLRDAVAACDAVKEEADLLDSRAVQMEREMGGLREQRQQARAALQAACVEGEEAEKRGEAARRELEGVRKELMSVRNELTGVRKLEKEVECVRRERDGLRKQQEGVQRELGLVEKELKGVRDELEGVQKEGEDLRRRLEASETGLEKAQRVVQAKEEDLTRGEEMAAEKERELEGRVVILEGTLKTAQAEVELLEQSRGSMAEDLAAAEERLAGKEEEVVFLEKEVERTKGLCNRLEKELLERGEEGERLEGCVAELEAALASARGKLTAAGRKSEALETLVHNLQDELSKAREVQGLRAAAGEQEGQLDGGHVAGEEGGHVAELAAVEKELAATRRAWGAGKEIIEELRAQLAACQDETRELEEKTELLRRELAANVIEMEAEVTARAEKGFGVWAVLLAAGWRAVWETEEERLGENGFSNVSKDDPHVRKRLTFDGEAILDLPAKAQGQLAKETDEKKEGCGKETQEEEETGVCSGSDVASDTRNGPSDFPGSGVVAAQQMLSGLRRQSERLHSQLAGLALTDGGRQRDVSEGGERAAGAAAGEQPEGELQAQLQVRGRTFEIFELMLRMLEIPVARLNDFQIYLGGVFTLCSSAKRRAADTAGEGSRSNDSLLGSRHLGSASFGGLETLALYAVPLNGMGYFSWFRWAG